MKTPDGKTIIFTFKSHPHRDLKVRWIAQMTFPGGVGAEASLPIAVTDGEGEPVLSGVFEFAGKSLQVEAGKTSINYADFIAGKHEKGVWLHRPNMRPVPGGLTFE